MLWLRTLAIAVLVASIAAAQPVANALPDDSSRPNILWIYVEDTNDWMSCYGDDLIQTRFDGPLRAGAVVVSPLSRSSSSSSVGVGSDSSLENLAP